MNKNNVKWRRILSHSMMALLFNGVMAGVTISSSGCGAPVEQKALSASNETLGTLDAQPQTRTETGIVGWTVTREGAGVLIDGKTAQGASIHQVRMQPFTATVTGDGRPETVAGYDIISSGGGFVRIGSDARVLEYTPDNGAFAAFARDAGALPKSDITLNCSVFAWIACGGAVLGAIASCGTLNVGCVAALLGTGSCFDCFCQHFGGCGGTGGGGGGGTGGGGGGGSGGGPGVCSDCGDGMIVCAPQQCP